MSSAHFVAGECQLYIDKIDRLLALKPATIRSEMFIAEVDILIAAAEVRERRGTWLWHKVPAGRDRDVLRAAGEILDTAGAVEVTSYLLAT